MDSYDVKRLALVFALAIEVEGMKAENIRWTNEGKPPTYGEDDFSDQADQMRSLANCHNEQL